VIKHFCPRLVELHNYSPASATQQKIYNWTTLNQRAMKRLSMNLTQSDITSVCACKPNAVERVLRTLMVKIPKFLSKEAAKANQQPLASQEQAAARMAGVGEWPRSLVGSMCRRTAPYPLLTRTEPSHTTP
jgi:hypothetical protein